MELFTLSFIVGFILIGALLCPTGLPVIAAILISAIYALRKRYGAGAVFGFVSVAFFGVFEWFWGVASLHHGGVDLTWLERLELAFIRRADRMTGIELAILACALLVTMVNVMQKFLAPSRDQA